MLPWLLWSILWLQESDYSKLSYYNWIEWLVKSKAANALFIFDEIVMVIKIHSENGGTLLQRLLHKEKRRWSAFRSLNRLSRWITSLSFWWIDLNWSIMWNTACKTELKVVYFTVDQSKLIISNEQSFQFNF